MFDPLKQVTSQLKISAYKISIDDLIFKLHYRATFLLLMVSALLVTQRQFIGEHIRCINDKSIPDNVINTFCFFSSTFTVVRHFNETALNLGYIPHPGIGPEEDDETVHHSYYQWVPFVLFFQAISFYLPHYVWRKKEDNRLHMLVSGLRMAYFSFYEEDQKQKDDVIIPSKQTIDKQISTLKFQFKKRYFTKNLLILIHFIVGAGVLKSWSLWLISCEILNLLNLILQIFITNLFLGGAFMKMGRDVWYNDDWDDDMDPLDIVFPKVTKCTFYKYGASGNIQNHDAICVMALNVIHEKIYAFLWFWYCFLLIATTLGLLNRLIMFIFSVRSSQYNFFMFSVACNGNYNRSQLNEVTKNCDFGSWLFLYFLARNMNYYVFKTFLENAYDDIVDKHNPPAKMGSEKLNLMQQNSDTEA